MVKVVCRMKDTSLCGITWGLSKKVALTLTGRESQRNAPPLFGGNRGSDTIDGWSVLGVRPSP